MQKILKFLKLFGPGLVTGAADDDPSGIATYSQTGAEFGYQQLWVMLFTTPFMIVIQEMCGRIGMVTGWGIAGIIRKYYVKPILYIVMVILIFANVINIGADLAAMAQTVQLLLHAPFIILMGCLAVVSATLEIIIPYKIYVKYLKYSAMVLLAYIITAFIVRPPLLKVTLSTVVPHLIVSKAYLLNLVAILGTTISPYLFFWQSNEVIEERIRSNRQKDIGRKVGETTRKDIFHLRFDTITGMIFSNIVSFFIIVTASATLGAHGKTDINTASQAAAALKPFAGNFAFLLFAIGIISSGLLAVPVLAGSISYALSETFHWKAGLAKKPRRAPVFYTAIAAATIIGFFITFSPIPPFKLLYYSAALNGLADAPLMIMILFICNNKKVMKTHTNSLFSNIAGWIITASMAISAIVLVFTLW